MIKLYNTLTRKIEEFKPIAPPAVKIYTCGPTVYDFQHIGNFRTMIFSDVLVRTLTANGYEVNSVRNITDIDDKIIKRATERGITISELSEEYTRYFVLDLNKLKILPVNHSPKATEHVTSMIKFIEELIEKEIAYVEKDGSVYFDISKFPDYGKLSQIEKRELKSGTRILSDEYTKDDVQDFALWKSVEPGELGGYDSPWGLGRPGWHIECSVMAQDFLGETIDIHAGGIDLMFPHHENEIAQSEARSGKEFVNYFIHGDHVLVDGKKMSKSLGNFYKLSDLEEKGFDPLAYRYLVLSAHYRDKLNFTWESVQSAQNALTNVRNQIMDWDVPAERGIEEYEKRFLEAMNDDLGTPQALAIMWELVKSDAPSAQKAATLIKMDEILGLDLAGYINKQVEVSEDVQELLEKREKAREQKNFELSDTLRDEIKEKGFEVLDTPEGPKVKKIL